MSASQDAGTLAAHRDRRSVLLAVAHAALAVAILAAFVWVQAHR